MPATPGTVVSTGALIAPGGEQGATGSQGLAGTPGISTLATTSANGLLKQISGSTGDFIDGSNNSQNLVTAIQPTIWNQARRMFNAIGNPTFEVDQRTVGNGVAVPSGAPFGMDRFALSVTAAGANFNFNQGLASGVGGVIVPGTNFKISNNLCAVTLTAQKASLAAGDFVGILHTVEGPNLRELINDVHSMSIMALTNVSGGLKFGVSIRDPGATRSLVKLCTIPQNVWTQVSLPNLPVFPSSGNFSLTPGTVGYTLVICLGSGTTFTTSANDVWVNANVLGAIGQDNLASKPTNSYLYLGFIQHEPGPLCTTFQDKSFDQNLTECQRYFTKSHPYGTRPGTAAGGIQFFCPANSGHPIAAIPFKRTMAKAPTITGYNGSSGAANSVRDVSSAADRAITGPVGVFDTGFAGFTVTGGIVGIWQTLFDYTADTGW